MCLCPINSIYSTLKKIENKSHVDTIIEKELPVNVRRNHKARVKTPDKQSGTGIFTVTDDMR